VRHGLRILVPYKDGDNWSIRGVVNPSKEERTAAKAALAQAREGITVGGVKYFPEAGLLGGGKHGLSWTEGPARAKDTGNPQGKFGSVADVNYAAQQASTLGPRKDGTFPLPAGHSCIMYMPDGSTGKPTQVFVKVYESGKVHAYPL